MWYIHIIIHAINKDEYQNVMLKQRRQIEGHAFYDTIYMKYSEWINSDRKQIGDCQGVE